MTIQVKQCNKLSISVVATEDNIELLKLKFINGKFHMLRMVESETDWYDITDSSFRDSYVLRIGDILYGFQDDTQESYPIVYNNSR